MNNTNYMGIVRGTLCHALTELRYNYKKIRRIRESAEDMEVLQTADYQFHASIIDKELAREIEFYETLNDIYNIEINRLVTIILENSTEI